MVALTILGYRAASGGARRTDMGYFRILAAIPGFFLSSLFLMLLWDVVAPSTGLTPGITYVKLDAGHHHALDRGGAAGRRPAQALS